MTKIHPLPAYLILLQWTWWTYANAIIHSADENFDSKSLNYLNISKDPVKIRHFSKVHCSRAEIYSNPYDTITYPPCKSSYCYDFAGTMISPYSKEHDYQEQECDTHNWCDAIGNTCTGVDIYYKKYRSNLRETVKKKQKFMEYTGILCCCRNMSHCNNVGMAWNIYWGWLDYPKPKVIEKVEPPMPLENLLKPELKVVVHHQRSNANSHKGRATLYISYFLTSLLYSFNKLFIN